MASFVFFFQAFSERGFPLDSGQGYNTLLMNFAWLDELGWTYGMDWNG